MIPQRTRWEIFWGLGVAVLLAHIGRWLHPAVITLDMYVLLVAVTAGAGIIALHKNQDDE